MASSAQNPNAILEEIYVEKVKLDEEEKHKSNKIIEFIREVLLRRMCENNDHRTNITQILSTLSPASDLADC